MKIEVPMSAETELQLRQQAQAAGQDITTFVLEALEEKLSSNVISAGKSGPVLTSQQRITKLLEWAASHKPLPFEADDSRESIYEGRGE